MPIYGYECDQCGHQLEVFQNMSDAPLKECPECGGVLHKRLYPVGVVFKGSGFYTTDYKGQGAGNGSKSESKGDSKSESKSESKGDSKDSAPSESKASTASDSKPAGKPAPSGD